MESCFGKYLKVDLSNGSLEDYEIPEEWIKKYLGGRGIRARILLEEISEGEDPLALKIWFFNKRC